MAAGESHTVAVKWDGTLWTWGSNAYGQLGDGSNPPQLAPEPIP
jgi:alpha-tubulin suppressor-like RCC1 family protein